MNTAERLVAQALRGAVRKRLHHVWDLHFPADPNFDVALDGQSFVMVEADEGWGQSSEVRLILDWFDEVLRLAPVDR